MMLEASIRKEMDNFMFPGMNKGRCDLDLELNFMENKIGQRPVTDGRGSVKSQLNTEMKCA